MRGRARARGYTLFEVMIAVVVLAILVSVGWPGFRAAIRSNSVSTTTNELVASINLARTEALRNPMGAGICASSDGETCGSDWGRGWVVWTSGDSNQELGGDDQILRFVQPRAELQISMQSGGAPGSKVWFHAQGRPQVAGTFTLQPRDCPKDAKLVRALAVGATGQVTVTRGDCT